jgi:hypothetical protein
MPTTKPTLPEALAALTTAVEAAQDAARVAHETALADYKRAISTLAAESGDTAESAAIYQDVLRLGGVIEKLSAVLGDL